MTRTCPSENRSRKSFSLESLQNQTKPGAGDSIFGHLTVFKSFGNDKLVVLTKLKADAEDKCC